MWGVGFYITNITWGSYEQSSNFQVLGERNTAEQTLKQRVSNRAGLMCTCAHKMKWNSNAAFDKSADSVPNYELVSKNVDDIQHQSECHSKTTVMKKLLWSEPTIYSLMWIYRWWRTLRGWFVSDCSSVPWTAAGSGALLRCQTLKNFRTKRPVTSAVHTLAATN